MEAIGTLAGGIAHDFNNILGVIIGCSELVLQGIPDTATAKTDMETVLDAALRAKSLTNQILSFSRQSEGETRPLLLSPFIKEITKFLRATLPVTIEMRIETEASSGAVLSDPIQIQQILMNLCTNAAQAIGPREGKLIIKLCDVEIDKQEASRFPELQAGPYVKLTVTDNGPGIPDDIIHRIFDPFFTTKKVGEGTGLGLSAVHGIVKQLNGAVFVDSRMGEGTAFRVFFPKIQHPDIEIATEQVSDLPRGKERILLVDDEAVLKDILKRILSGLGYHVEAQTSPMRALEVFRNNPHRFNLLISDQTMPEMTGTTLIERVHSIRPTLPVILCTGLKDSTPETVEKAAGVNRTLIKPIRRDELALIIREVLDD
jgi:CheY-like chemotaxis protein/two-component sensor histidine kinase